MTKAEKQRLSRVRGALAQAKARGVRLTMAEYIAALDMPEVYGVQGARTRFTQAGGWEA